MFEKHGWQYRIGIEPDKAEDVGDLERLLHLPGVTNPACMAAEKKFKNR
jgi:hypothetical protein